MFFREIKFNERIKRFGGTVKESKEEFLEKKKMRAQKFGTSVKELDIEKRQKRLERFGKDAFIDALRQSKRSKF